MPSATAQNKKSKAMYPICKIRTPNTHTPTQTHDLFQSCKKRHRNAHLSYTTNAYNLTLPSSPLPPNKLKNPLPRSPSPLSNCVRLLRPASTSSSSPPSHFGRGKEKSFVSNVFLTLDAKFSKKLPSSSSSLSCGRRRSGRVVLGPPFAAAAVDVGRFDEDGAGLSV